MKLCKSTLKLTAILAVVAISLVKIANAQTTAEGSNLLKGEVVQILSEEVQTTYEGEIVHQKISVDIGANIVTVEATILPLTGKEKLQIGDDLLVYAVTTEGQTRYFVSDYNREKPIILLLGLFVFFVVLVTRKWGVFAILGMAYSFAIIFKFILPQILSGTDPLLVALSGSILIAPITFALSHGINKKTVAGILGTFIALSITGLLAVIFTQISHLSGFGSEESLFLQISQGSKLNMKGVFLAGIIIGTLGILDDVTISQASIVKQLKTANPNLKKVELYKLAMNVGHDHISSAVNTLVLVYTGASMPLLLIFLVSNQSFGGAINFQVIAEEIVRTLVGSIGLVIAVPITTILATVLLDNKEEADCDKKLPHHH